MLKSMEELSGQPGKFSGEQVHGLAHLLADIARTRFYDFRLKMLEDFDRIDQYLTAQNLYPLRDIRYFTRLQDMYWNSTQVNRFSGQRFQFMPQLTLHKETDYYSYGLGLHAGYEKFLPINMQWQINYHIQGGYNYQLFQDTDRYNRHVWQGLGSFSLAYYPDTRNILTLRSAISGSNPMDNVTLGGTVGLSYYRYFSPQLRLAVDLSYAHSAISNQRAVNSFNYGLGLNYAIF